MLTTLYKRNVNGSINQWSVLYDENGYWTEFGQVGGVITKSDKIIVKPKNIGKKNETNIQEQALKEQLDTFAFLLGIPQGTEIELSGEITPEFVDLNPEELYQKYLENNLEISLFKKNLELMKIQQSAQNLQIYTPAISLSYGWQPVLSDVTADWGDKDNWFDGGSFSATLVWNITNMLPFSSASLKARDLKDNIAQMNLNLISLEENAKMYLLLIPIRPSSSKSESVFSNVFRLIELFTSITAITALDGITSISPNE